jgi:hypothetical protein
MHIYLKEKKGDKWSILEREEKAQLKGQVVSL